MTKPKSAYLVLEDNTVFSCQVFGDNFVPGEVVFNTSHSGYEEMSSDPSYLSQILVTTAPMQGNYGVNQHNWESDKLWIRGFVCLEIQNSTADSSWLNTLLTNNIPVVTEIDTRSLVVNLREKGVVWGCISTEDSIEKAINEVTEKIKIEKENQDKDWTKKVSVEVNQTIDGLDVLGPRVAVIDFGCKKNIIKELKKRCRQVVLVPSHIKKSELKQLAVDALLFSNGPGDPEYVKDGIELAKNVIGDWPIFGICMGHQVLALSLGCETYKLKYGHRGGNHPVKNCKTGSVFMTSQNHGYAVKNQSLPKAVSLSYVNLNDNTISGISYLEKNMESVQFHPESSPGPNDTKYLFDEFIKRVKDEL